MEKYTSIWFVLMVIYGVGCLVPPHFNADGIMVALTAFAFYMWLKRDWKLA